MHVFFVCPQTFFVQDILDHLFIHPSTLCPMYAMLLTILWVVRWCTFCCSFQRWPCHIWLVDRLKFASLEDLPFNLSHSSFLSPSLWERSPDMNEILLTGTLSHNAINTSILYSNDFRWVFRYYFDVNMNTECMQKKLFHVLNYPISNS